MTTPEDTSGFIFTVCMDRRGHTWFAREEYVPQVHEGHRLFVSIGHGMTLENNLLTRDKTTAVKATNELRTRLIAQGKWE